MRWSLARSVARGSILRACLAIAVALLSGCAFQASDVVLIREPGNRLYSDPQPVRDEARQLADYAAMSANAYDSVWRDSTTLPRPRAVTSAGVDPEAVRRCEADPTPLPLDGWMRWSKPKFAFPSQALIDESYEVGLFFEVWEKLNVDPPLIAIAFRGTEGDSWRDWATNFQWLLKWLPGWKDQYEVVRNGVRQELIAELAKRLREPDLASRKPRIVTTGHSLGGGLAQQLAYALLDEASPPAIPAIAEVFAFDSSPVTGWYSVRDDLRHRNAEHLRIERVFEHGEALAFVRLLFSYLYPPSATAPAIAEVRFNFNQSWNPFGDHGMRGLACHLQFEAEKAAAR
jgi:hypothetical protein